MLHIYYNYLNLSNTSNNISYVVIIFSQRKLVDLSQRKLVDLAIWNYKNIWIFEKKIYVGEQKTNVLDEKCWPSLFNLLTIVLSKIQVVWKYDWLLVLFFIFMRMGNSHTHRNLFFLLILKWLNNDWKFSAMCKFLYTSGTVILQTSIWFFIIKFEYTLYY